MAWVNDFGFVANPYRKLDPFTISLDKLEWNRTDMTDQFSDLESFVNDLSAGEKTGVRVIGAIGSGKTWFARMIEKYLIEVLPDAVFIYTKVPKMEPTFGVVFSIAIQNFLENFSRVSQKVNEQAGGLGEEEWLSIFKNEDLSKGLCVINGGTAKNKLLAKSWLSGNRMTSASLNAINVVNPLTSDYLRFKVLVDLYQGLTVLFPCAVLVLDELENAPPKLASALSDGLRDMLSEFSEKFGMVCLFTAQSFDEWYDSGFTEALTRRLDYHINIPEVSKPAFLELIRKHQELYRVEGFDVNDQAFPFSEEAILKIHDLTQGWKKYPGYLLPNCEAIAKVAHNSEGAPSPITSDFVVANSSKLPNLRDSSEDWFEPKL